MIEFIATLGAGIFAGILGGLLGIGGGIIIMPFLRFIVGLTPMAAAGTCIIAVFFTTIGGSYRHYQLGHINFRSILPLILSGVISTVIFSLIFLQLAKRQSWIDLGVGLVFVFVSVRMIREGLFDKGRRKTDKNTDNSINGSLPKKLTLGSAAGILPGLLGIGTGAILVPAFTFFFGASVKVAMGSSLACFAANAFCSSIFKLSQGFVDVSIAIPISLGAVIGANIGAVLNKNFPSSALKIIFGIVFAYVSMKFILFFFTIHI